MRSDPHCCGHGLPDHGMQWESGTGFSLCDSQDRLEDWQLLKDSWVTATS